MNIAAEGPPGGGDGPAVDPPNPPRTRRRSVAINFTALRQLLGLRRREQPAPTEGDMLSPMILQAERQRLAEVREQLVALEDELRTQSQEAEQEIQRLNDLVASLRAEIARIQGEGQTREVVEFQATLRILEERRVRLEREHAVEITEIRSSYTQRIATQRAMLDATMQNLETRMEELHVSQSLYSEAAELLMIAREEAAEYRARNEELERNLEELREQLRQENSHIVSLTSEIRELRNEINELVRTVERLREEVRMIYRTFYKICISVFLYFLQILCFCFYRTFYKYCIYRTFYKKCISVFFCAATRTTSSPTSRSCSCRPSSCSAN